MDEIQPEGSQRHRSRRLRSVWIVGVLILSTLGGLVLAWARPDDTVWQFWIVTQCLPLLYLGLSIWAAWPGLDESDS